METITQEDFKAMSRQKLLSWWLSNQMDEVKIGGSIPWNIEKVVASFDAYGHDKVSQILAGFEYTKPEVHPQEISHEDAMAFLKEMKTANDFRVFEVSFLTKKENAVRHMICHHLPQNVEDKPNLDMVWDIDAEPRYTIAENQLLMENKMQPKPKGALKSINLLGLISFTINDTKYVVKS